MPRRRKILKFKRRYNPAIEAFLDNDGTEAENKEYTETLGDYLSPSNVAKDRSAPDTETVTRVLSWVMEDSGAMAPDLSKAFGPMLNDYKTKLRIINFAITRERIERIVEAVNLERELVAQIRNSMHIMSVENKVKALAAISESINDGLENLDTMAGIAETPDEIFEAMKGHMKEGKSDAPFEDLRPDERENVRKAMEKIRKGFHSDGDTKGS